MKAYRAIGRQGEGVVRLFDSPMTHAVDVDGSIERYFTSESAARDFAFEMVVDGRDAVVVVATPCETAPALKLQGSFAERLRRLFDTVPSADGSHYSPDNLADALYGEGIPLASRLVDRLLSGIGGQPPVSTISAVARFFGVEPELLGGNSGGVGPPTGEANPQPRAVALPTSGVFAKARNNDPAVPFNYRTKPFKSGRGFAVDIRVRDYNGSAAERYAEGVIIGFWESEKQARRVADDVNSGKRYDPRHQFHSRAHSAIVIPAWNVSESQNAGLPWETPEGSAEMVSAYASAGVPTPQWLLRILSRLEEGGFVPSVSASLGSERHGGSFCEPSLGSAESGFDSTISHRRVDSLDDELLHLIRDAVDEGEVVWTLGTASPNRIVSVDEAGIRVSTEQSDRKGTEPQLVPAWMIVTAWEHLRQHGDLTQKQLDDELNVTRSAFICALLSRLPNVQYDSVPLVALRLVRDEYVLDVSPLDGLADVEGPLAQELNRNHSNQEPDAADPDGYADRLNRLFATVHPDSRGPYSNEEVAEALQAEGISLHASSISRLRAGTGTRPQENVTHALAYFFNIDPDYLFSASTSSFNVPNSPLTSKRGTVASQRLSNATHQEADPIGEQVAEWSANRVEAGPTGDAKGGSEYVDHPIAGGIRLSTAELLKLSAGLSQAAHSASRRPHTDLSLVRRFVELLTEVAAFLQTSFSGGVVIPIRFLEHALVEWDQTEPADNGTEPAYRWLAELLNRHIDG